MFARLTSIKSLLSPSIVVGLVAGGLSTTVLASTDLDAPHYPWPHNGFFSSFDHASLRRGFEVYRQVCSTCHSMKYLHYRNLIGTTHTEEQARALAESVMVQDGPNDEGNMFERPGKLFDSVPKPYPNDEYARFINGGALPPDLSLMVKARHGGCDYVFSILTGYRDAPHGFALRQGLYYNPYFPGGALAMPPPLNDGGIEYEDGTPATITQQAKDVTAFLNWIAEPEHDERKKNGTAFLFGVVTATAFAAYWKRFVWHPLKARRITWVDTPSQQLRRDKY